VVTKSKRLSQSGSMPSGGRETPGSEGHTDGLGVGTGSFGAAGVAGMQGTDGRTGGEMEGQGNGERVGVGRAGGERVGMHFGNGRLGNEGRAGAATPADPA
jgi:hypothetical protein